MGIYSHNAPARQQPGYAFINGGNAFGQDATLGTTDNFDLTIIRDNVAFISIGNGDGSIFFGSGQQFLSDGSIVFNNGASYIDASTAFFSSSIYFDVANGAAILANGAIAFNQDGSANLANGAINFYDNGTCDFVNSAIRFVAGGGATFANGNVGINSNGRFSLNGVAGQTLNFATNITAPLVPTIAGWIVVEYAGTAFKMPYYNN